MTERKIEESSRSTTWVLRKTNQRYQQNRGQNRQVHGDESIIKQTATDRRTGSQSRCRWNRNVGVAVLWSQMGSGWTKVAEDSERRSDALPLASDDSAAGGFAASTKHFVLFAFTFLFCVLVCVCVCVWVGACSCVRCTTQ